MFLVTPALICILAVLNISARDVNDQTQDISRIAPRKLSNNVTELHEIIVELEKNNLEKDARIFKLENEIKSWKTRKFTIALHSVQVNEYESAAEPRKIVKTNWTRCPLAQSKSEVLKIILTSLRTQVKMLEGKVKSSEEFIRIQDIKNRQLEDDNKFIKSNLTKCQEVISTYDNSGPIEPCGGIITLFKNSSKLLTYNYILGQGQENRSNSTKLCVWTIKCFHGCSIVLQEIKLGKLVLSSVEWEDMDLPTNHILKENVPTRIIQSWGYVSFHSDEPGSRFRIKIDPNGTDDSSQIRGYSIFRYENDTGSIFSHPVNYGLKNYANNEMTTLVLSSQKTKHVVFKSLEFEPCDDKCSCDYINFFTINAMDGMKRLGERICILPNMFLMFETEILVLVFRSDDRNNGKGFSFLYVYTD